MQVIAVYERPTNRHGWRILTEQPATQKDLVIEGAKNWRAQLNARWLPRQLGYIITEQEDNGWINEGRPLKANDPRIRRIE